MDSESSGSVDLHAYYFSYMSFLQSYKVQEFMH